MNIYSQLFDSLKRELSADHTLEQCIQSPAMLDGPYVAKCTLMDSLYKKLKPSRGDRNLADIAIASFRSSNERCKGWAVSEASCDLLHDVRTQLERDLLPVKDWSWQDYLDHAGLIPGTGASLKSRGRNSLFEKLFVNRRYTTNRALIVELNRYYQRTNPSLLRAEQQRQILTGEVATVVNYSRTTTVRKNAKTDRTICTEPSINMLFQRALGEGLNLCLRTAYGYDPALQPDRNRELARLGSMFDKLATIDLKSASDTIALNLCRAVMPSWIMAAIDDCRCPVTVVGDDPVVLHMTSSMGNGFTFPLQTLIFAALVRVVAKRNNVVYRRFHLEPRADLAYGVFGDDIICPTSIYNAVLDGLVALGFVPNVNKSYGSGFFRESCGSDWYNGYNVRGVYVKSLQTEQDYASAYNRLMRWACVHSISIPVSLSLLLCKGWRRHIIPCHHADTEGYKMPPQYCRRDRYGGFRYFAWLNNRRPFELFVRDKLTSLLVFKRTHENFYGWLLTSLGQVDAPLDGPLVRVAPDRGVLLRRPGEGAGFTSHRLRSVTWFLAGEPLCTTALRQWEVYTADVLAVL